MVLYKSGQRVSEWLLIELLGEGGNAEVWRATKESGERVALKLLHNRDARGEPYKRFTREVEVQTRLTTEGFDGTLPVLGASVPLNPSRASPAWLAMPEAELLPDAFGAAPSLVDVIAAHADIAVTLARLAGRGIHHRDIKPSNLYRLDGHWLVGDFGLVEVPEGESLTTGAKGLGPRHFLAPEMLMAPDAANGAPADVYSLAKCLWVCGTGQRVPPPGEQRLDVPALCLSSYVRHPRAIILDRLIDRATRTDPRDRPTMSEFATELSAWLREPQQAAAPADLVGLRSEVDAVIEPSRRAQQEVDERQRQGRAVLMTLLAGLKLAERRLGSELGLPPLSPSYADGPGLRDRIDNWVLMREEWSDVQLIKVGREVEHESKVRDNSPRSVYMWGAASIRVTNDGQVVVASGYAVGREARYAHVVWSHNELVALGSARQEELVARLLAGIDAHLPEAVRVLIDAMKPRSTS